MKIMVDGVPVEMDLPVPSPSSFVSPRNLSSLAFLDLWKPSETAATMAADPLLWAGCLKVLAQGSANLDSPEMASLLSLAVSKGTLTSDRKAQILAGTAPTAS